MDGGGIRGVYTAAVLAEFEQQIGRPLFNYFDLIVGTSTGGILAIGLGLGIPAEKLLTFYRDNGPLLFEQTGVKIVDTILHASGPKYDSNKLYAALKSVLDDSKFGDAKRPLVIVSYNVSRDGPHLFKSHGEKLEHRTLEAAQVALATSAAPTYFRSVEIDLVEHGVTQTFVDGGVWANCPTLVGITEAVSPEFAHQRKLEDLYVLSVGTTYAPFKHKPVHDNAGFARWGKDLVTLVGSAQQAGAWGTTCKMLGKSHCLRITTETDKGIELGDVSRIKDLDAWGREEARAKFDKAKPMFFS